MMWISCLTELIAGFLMQLRIELPEMVNNAVAVDYILDLTSGVTGRIVNSCISLTALFLFLSISFNHVTDTIK